MSGDPRAVMARKRLEQAEEREDNGPSTERNSLASDAAADGRGDESSLSNVMVIPRGHIPERDSVSTTAERTQPDIALATDGEGWEDRSQ